MIKDWSIEINQFSSSRMALIASSGEERLPFSEPFVLALNSAHALAAFLTYNFHKSEWTDQEVGIALGRGLLVIPVYLEIDPYGFMARKQAMSGNLKNIERLAMGLINILTLLEDNPYEKESFVCMFSACGNDQPLKDFTVADLAGCGPNANRITLTTLHSSKGLQFDIVIIPGLEDGRLPSWGVKSETAMKEARRTFYVGFTRARYQVYLLYSGWYQNQYGRTFKKGPSRFVSELQNKLECKL